MRSFIGRIDKWNKSLGEGLAWLNLLMVLTTFVVVVFRYLFGLGWVWLQDISMYAHVFVFLGAAGYALQENSHVRVDVFYHNASAKNKARVNALGTLFLLFPFCGLIVLYSWNYIAHSWQVFEGSKDGGGLEAVFLLKSFILVYSLSLFLQGVSLLSESWKAWRE